MLELVRELSTAVTTYHLQEEQRYKILFKSTICCRVKKSIYAKTLLGYIENFQQYAFQLLSNHHFESNFHSSRTYHTVLSYFSKDFYKAYWTKSYILSPHRIANSQTNDNRFGARPKHLCVLHCLLCNLIFPLTLCGYYFPYS